MHCKSLLLSLLLIATFSPLLEAGHHKKGEAKSPIAKGAKLVTVGEGYRFTEGPAVAPNGDVYFSDIPEKKIYHWSHATGKVTLAIENSGGSNGLYFDKKGRLLACQTVLKQVAILDPTIKADGGVKTLTATYKGKPFNKPNDLWIDAKGGVYFTDPNYGRQAMTQDGEYVYYLPAGTPGKEPIRLIKPENFGKPNGIIGTPDGKKLYVAFPQNGQTYVYDIQEDGTIKSGKSFYGAGSDGMALDEKGNLYLTLKPGLTIVSPEGKLIAEMEVGTGTTNVCFGGKDGKTLFLTAKKFVCTLQMNVKGADYLR